MRSDIPYSPRQDDLYYPCKRANFFSDGRPKTESALCAEMSRLAYCREQSTFAFNRKKIQDVLIRVGFPDCHFFENPKRPLTEGTHAFLAVQHNVDKSKNLAVVAFRGTDKDDPTDLADDAEFILVRWEKGGRVHTGFANALADVRSELDLALSSVSGRILFTGHSLGAALATLLASVRNPAALYTFGSPRVGDADFIATLNGVDNHRYVDCCDVVTRVPPEFLEYRHLGKPHYIDRKRKVTFNRNGLAMWYDRLRAEADYVKDYAWKLGNVGVRDLADHTPFNYVMPVTHQGNGA